MIVAFPKDILIIDFETTGPNYPDMLPIQIGATQLDKKTLEEKKSYLSNIRVDFSLVMDIARKVTGLKEEDLKDAPTIEIVGKEFYETFGTDFFVCSWVHNIDHRMLEKILKAGAIDINKYDYHFFDLWPIAYLYLLKQGYSGSPRADEMFKALGLPHRATHNALEDCRYVGAILRKLATFS